MYPAIKIIKSNRKTIGIEVAEKGITVRAPRWATKQEVLKFVKEQEDWIYKQLYRIETKKREMGNISPISSEELEELANKALKIIPEKVEYYARILNVTYNKITIRLMSSRWGSCSSKGNLSFNCLLMLTPDEVIDSVIVHELCHRKYMNHSKLFYEEVLKAYPEYKKWNKWLKDNGGAIIHRAFQ